jgi:predicted O-methyltransferase YrrM
MVDVSELRARVLERESALRSAIAELHRATNEPYIPTSVKIDQELLDNCKMLSSRYELLDYMPKQSVCMEVGTQYGHFAKSIMNRADPAKLHIIDIDLSLFDKATFDSHITNKKVHLHEGDSSKVIKEFPENYFDWIYIDAQHSYEGFTKDLNASAKVVKENGFIVCNDYTVYSPPEVYPYGVLRGLNEFCMRHRWKMRFFALHSQGYHDVCIQKPSV